MNTRIQTAVANKESTENTGKKTLQQYLALMQPGIEKALPSMLTPERFTRIVMTALSSNPKLAECTPESFIGAMMTTAQLGLEPNTPLGQAYLIPYAGKCQFQLGYRGLLDLAYRSGEMSNINAHIVYENDEFIYAYGLDPVLTHIPVQHGERGEMTHVYAIFKTKEGGHGFEVMSISDVMKHAKKHSKSFNSGAWATNFEEMAKKTVLKALLKYAPLKIEFAKGLAQDQTIKTEISEHMIDVPTVTAQEVYEEQIN